MLTGLHLVVIGGDARQLEVIRILASQDASLSIVGFDKTDEDLGGATKCSLTDELLRSADALILPSVSSDEHGQVMAVFSEQPVYIHLEQLMQLPSHCVVYAGVAHPKMRLDCSKLGIPLVELFERDDVAILNSIPTAEGAVMMAMEHTKITIHGSSCVVLGMGRTGLTLARTLQGLGAKVKVGVRREEHFARAYEHGFEPFYLTDLADNVSNIDLLFNTIPTMIITAQIVASMSLRTVIIDLASKPGGTDFRFAQKRGVKALLAPGLPGIVAPVTAGRVIAQVLSRLLQEKTI